MYGIPKFNPRRINIVPKSTKYTGTILRIKFRTGIEIKSLKNCSKNIKKLVPTPKKNIKRAPVKGLPVAIAPATPAYTNPQGRKPFKKPMAKLELNDFFFRNTPNCFDKNENRPNDKLLKKGILK